MAHPTVEEICELLEGYAWELENASRRADAAGKAAVEGRLADVRSALDASLTRTPIAPAERRGSPISPQIARSRQEAA